MGNRWEPIWGRRGENGKRLEGAHVSGGSKFKGANTAWGKGGKRHVGWGRGEIRVRKIAHGKRRP